MTSSGGDWSMRDRVLGHERACRLSNTVHSEVAPCLPLPSLPVFCGAVDQYLRLNDEPTSAASRSVNRKEVLDKATRIADLLRVTDVSYLKLREGTSNISHFPSQPSSLYKEVLRHNSEAFDYVVPGLVKERNCRSSVSEVKPFKQDVPTIIQVQNEWEGAASYRTSENLLNDAQASVSSRKPRVRKKGSDEISLSARPDPVELQDGIIRCFVEVVEEVCRRVEAPNEDQDEADAQLLSSSDLKLVTEEIMSICAKKILHLVPVNILVRLLSVLDRHIHVAEGLSIDDNENFDSDVMSMVFSALESTHASLLIMTHHDMPKQLYKEEIIERILDFSRLQILECMSACDPSYRALHKPSENGAPDGDNDEDVDGDFVSAGKKRRNFRSVKMKKSTGNKVPAAVNTVLRKLCTILGFLKDLLVFSSYTHHRNFLVDETVQLLWKLPFSKRAVRAYHLPDEEQIQIQMISALLIQLVQCSASVPETLRQPSSTSILEVSIDASYPSICNEAATDACCLFWTRVLQRLTTVKAQDVSELKVSIENLIMDLLATLNLPEYPASANILEARDFYHIYDLVLCVLLLQNAGLKSKDISARTLAIDILGTIAARLKRDSALCSKDRFWVLEEMDLTETKDVCSVCRDGKGGKLLYICNSCQRVFHADCMGVKERGPPSRSWYCQFCTCKKQLSVLQSYCNSQNRDDEKSNCPGSGSSSENSEPIVRLEVVQQILLNYLQEAVSADDAHFFARWFYLCLWYKDDPKSQQKFTFYLAKLKSRAILRDFWTELSSLTRDSAKRISLALGQNNSFSRGFDTILCMLLASLRENSPILRAKALRAVSIIVEADPEVLCDKRVQSAVEGRFCDSAISVREAALELVGRHIASHPDVGLQYFEKVAERVKDTGVSVRKRAIKIIRDMCTSNANFSEFTKACLEIISRISDEESSIQDLVCKTFYEFWFEEPTVVQTEFVEDGSSVPLEVAKKTEQIVQMLRRMPNHQLLVTVIRRNLSLEFSSQSAKAVGINPLSLASVRKRCELMCKRLLERILQEEETDSKEGEVHALPYVLVLHAFCVVDPTLCAPASDPSQFVVTLHPYLKSQVDNRAVSHLLESIIFVIDAVLPLVRKPPLSFVKELEQDLVQMIIRHSFLTVVHACIKCLCTLSKVAGKGCSIIKNLIEFYLKRLDTLTVDNKQAFQLQKFPGGNKRHILGRVTSLRSSSMTVRDKVTKAVIPTGKQVGRSLFCLGLLMRFGNELMMASDDRNVHADKSLSLIKHFLFSEDFVIKVRSLQALGYVLIARPDYMLQRDVGKILEATFSATSDARLKMQALQNMYEYLLDAESQMGTDKAGSNKASYPEERGNGVPVAAGAGDTNICGGIIQLYWDGILGRCLDMNEQVRQTALKIVEVVLRQGLVHPITCVPYLIALETDLLESNWKLAHHLLSNMNEKYPSFFESRLGDGLQMSFSFIQSMTSSSLEYSSQKKLLGSIKGKPDGNSITHARVGVSRIYRVIRGNRVSRNKFMSSVVRKFDCPIPSPSQIPFLTYCTEILASLPFSSPDEPLYLIYTINRVIQVRAGSIEANMKAFSSYSLEGEDFVIPHGNGVGTIDSVPLHTSDHLMNDDVKLQPINAADSYSILKVDLQKVQAECFAAIALQLLLKLKRHLKIVFGLNDARCQAYSPNEPLKTGETLSKQNIFFNISEMPSDLPTLQKEVIERYQEFKAALKDDTIDYSVYAANIKRKRPAPRSSKGGRSGFDDEDDDGDEEWNASYRRLSSSGQKSTGSRGRQKSGRINTRSESLGIGFGSTITGSRTNQLMNPFDGHLLGTHACQPEFLDESDELNSDYEEWYSKDQYCLGWLVSTMFKDVAHAVVGAESAHEAWSQIQTLSGLNSLVIQDPNPSTNSAEVKHTTGRQFPNRIGFGNQNTYSFQYGGRGSNNCGCGGRFRGRGGFKSQNNKKPTCQICGKFGHSAAVCYFRGDMKYMGAQTNPTPVHAPQMRFPPQASTQPQNTFYAASEPGSDTSWYADTGASSHITVDTSQLNNCMPYQGGTSTVCLPVPWFPSSSASPSRSSPMSVNVVDSAIFPSVFTESFANLPAPTTTISEAPQNVHQMITRAKNAISMKKVFLATTSVSDDTIPKSVELALKDPKWREAMKKEYQALIKTNNNNAFLNGALNEDVYTNQSRGFVDDTSPTFVCKLHKALYGLRQALRAWFDRLRSTLLSSSMLVMGFSDTDWATSPDDHRSTTESEYRALAQVTVEISWVKSLLSELQLSIPTAPVVWCDNINAQALAHNPVYHAMTKHIKLDIHYVRDEVLAGQFLVQHVPIRLLNASPRHLWRLSLHIFVANLGAFPSPFV
ncbi:hypothetical protein Syun_023332 [Stephania yunnanensis]|uniref:Sister chromatid cohesion protein n=1 Tax=Stephania yunnanensis TaxID=152371 RepID=A0AAP0F9N1_9MAGN